MHLQILIAALFLSSIGCDSHSKSPVIPAPKVQTTIDDVLGKLAEDLDASAETNLLQARQIPSGAAVFNARAEAFHSAAQQARNKLSTAKPFAP